MLFADEIKADPRLTSALGQVAKGPQNDINSVYDRIRGGFNADSKARGVGPGSYAPGRFDTTQGLSQNNLKDSLESILGNTTYKDTLSQRDADQNEAMARETASLNKPNTLEEILSGLGGAAKLGGSIYGLSGGSSAPSSSSSLPPSLSLYNPYATGYRRYS